VDDRSLFSSRSLWTPSHIAELIEEFVRNPIDTPETSFLEKLKQQLSTCAPEVKQLMAEVLYVLTLFQSNMRPATKRELVGTIWSWSGTALPADHPFLEDGGLGGIGNPGAAFMAQRWREAAYLIELAAEFKKESHERREALATSPEDFAEWVDAIPTRGYRQFRNILVHLAFPDGFERITVHTHKRQILQAFGALPVEKLKTATEYELDVALRDLRASLVANKGTSEIDFYDDTLKPQWQSGGDNAPAHAPASARAWLLSWNPRRWTWTNFGQDRIAVARGDTVTEPWSCRNGHVVAGDRVFLMRAGEEPRGMIARGTALSTQYEAEHYDQTRAAAGATHDVIDVAFDDIRDPAEDAFLSLDELKKISGEQSWTPQQSGIEIRPEVIGPLETAWARLAKPALDEATAPTRAEMALPYTADDIFAEGCFHTPTEIDAILNSWNAKKNLVLQGPPGTGKTWLAKRLAYALIGFRDERRIVAVQFHPNLSYEDFVRGWRPSGDGKLTLVDGVFLEAVKAAQAEPALPYVIVIEEINRGNPAQIFGELLTLMENSKRDKSEAMRLGYPRDAMERVYVPKNLYVIGTMNVADRSLALVDLALRRRFAFVDLEPRFNDRWEKSLIADYGFEGAFVLELRSRIEALNQQIAGDDRLGPQYRIGHSYLTPSGGAVDDANAWFRNVVATQIGPLLREYWFDDKAEKARRACELLLKHL
jgi:5-methylcytosine-specific restriction protein B